MSTKVRKTLMRDPELVATFGNDRKTLSATVNSIFHAELDRRSRRTALAALVAELDAEFGEPDTADVRRFRRALA